MCAMTNVWRSEESLFCFRVDLRDQIQLVRLGVRTLYAESSQWLAFMD